METPRSTYRERKPIAQLSPFIHSFWTHQNGSDSPETITIVPDSYFKIVFLVQDDRILTYFMTGLWFEPRDFTFPPHSTSYGCRLKILAPEYLLQEEVASIAESLKPLDLSYLNISEMRSLSFDEIVVRWQKDFLKIKSNRDIHPQKIRLCNLLDEMNGAISATEVSRQIYWSSRQINRYLNKYLGTSLKKYLNVQRCYKAYIQIREGRFFPEDQYSDQSHFIREIKKYTGHTPRILYELKNDRFVQLKNIKQK